MAVQLDVRPQVDRFVFPDVHRTVFAQEHADYIGVKVEGRFKVEVSAESVVAGSGFGAIGHFVKLSADRARAGDTSHEKVPRHCQLMD